MKYQLKLAEYSIAQQSRLLKKLEKSKDRAKSVGKGIHYVRTHVLRNEARSHHIALGFLRGRIMDEMELPLRPVDKGHVTSKNLTRTPPNWERVEELIVKHGQRYFDSEQAIRQSFAEFRDGWTIGEV